MRCEHCLEAIRHMYSAYDQLSAVCTIIDALETEEAITPATANLMREKLQWLAKPALDSDELIAAPKQTEGKSP